MNYKERDKLMELLQEPRTVRELSKLAKMKYHTCRKKVLELVEEGVVDRLLYYRDREVLYQTLGRANEGDKYLLGFKGKPLNYKKALTYLKDDARKALQVFWLGVGYLGRNSYQVAQYGEVQGGFASEEIKTTLKEKYEEVKEAMRLMEQILSDTRIWGPSDPETYSRMDLNPENFQEIAMTFDNLVLNQD